MSRNTESIGRKVAVRPCPICGNREVDVLHHQKFVQPEGHILPAAYDLVACPRCGFCYADTPASQEIYDEYYEAFSKYEDKTTSTGGGASDWDSFRLQQTSAALAAAMPDRQARIVDVGCANGGLLAALKKLGYSYLVGIDPSPVCVANTQALHGIAARVGSIRRMPEAVGQFDLVLLSHVLEHVADLRAAVRVLGGLVKEGGLLYIEVPDASRYCEFMVAPFQDFNTEHINHFGSFSLANLFRQDGFTVESAGQKEIESSPGCPYPAVYSFFRRSSAPDNQVYEVDQSFREQMIRYIDKSRNKIARIDERLEDFVSNGQQVIVWGTGQLAMKLLAESSLDRARILAFVDGNSINQGKKLLNIPIIAPEQVEDRNTPILIATLLHHKEITDRIRRLLHLPNPIITLD